MCVVVVQHTVWFWVLVEIIVSLSSLCVSDQLRPFLDESAGSFVERLFEALEESRSSRGNKGTAEKNRKRELKVSLTLTHMDVEAP